MACLFIKKILNLGLFRKILWLHIRWLRYGDNGLVNVLRHLDHNKALIRINQVHQTITITIEEGEKDNSLLFLDVRLHKKDGSSKFSVYRKLINKDNFVNYLSAHSARTKMGSHKIFCTRIISRWELYFRKSTERIY